MTTTASLLQMFAIIYTIFGVTFLVRKESYDLFIKKFETDKTFLFFMGVLTTSIGAAMVSFYNVWVCDWSLFIKLFGWGALLKGILFLLKPKFTTSMVKSFNKKLSSNLIGTFVIIIGLLLAYASTSI